MTVSKLEHVLHQSRYEVLELLGQGDHGVVYRAYDKTLKIEVAIKTLRSRDPESLFRLKREFRALASIKHPNLASLYELEIHDDVFISMELVRGTNLMAALDSLASARRNESLRDYLVQILRGLSHLHDHGTLHRDIKPGNVMVEDGRVVLVDFGMATDIESRAAMMSMHASMAGTLAYMAPEQLLSQGLSGASDLYSVGVLLYECLCGRLPRATVQEILDTGSTPPSPAELEPSADRQLCDIAVRLMSPEPSARPRIEDLMAELCAGFQPAAIQPVGDSARGRGEELARIHTALDRVHRGESVSLAVRGPSGIGKSTLINTFLDRVEARDEALVFRSRCHPSEYIRYEAIDGLVDEISRFLSHLNEDQVEAYLPRHIDALSRVFPVLERILPAGRRRKGSSHADERELRRIAFESLRQLISRIGDRQTTVLWIDDLQWGDSDSANLIRELLREPDAPPVLFIFSYRTGEVDSPILRDLLCSDSGAWHGVENVDIKPLSDSDARSYLSDLTGEAEWSDHIRELLVEAEGSPFLIGELAKLIAESAEHARSDLGGIRLDELVKRRLQGLAPNLFQLLAYIAVSKGPIRRTIAYTASNLGAAAVEASAMLESQNLIKTVHVGKVLAFDAYHDRFRSAMLECVDKEMQKRLHGDILDALEEEAESGPELLAFHALRAERADSIVKYSVAAAELAESGLAFSLAAELYQQALTHATPTAERRAELLERCGRASALAGHGAAAAVRLRDAAEILASTGSPRVNHVRAAAAEQYLASGYLDEGHAMLKPLMQQRKIRFPESPAAAAARMIPMALALRVFGLRSASAPASDQQGELSDTELLWSAAKGLGAMDSLRSSYFNCLGLRISLARGDRVAATKFLCGFVGTTLVPAGGATKRWGMRLLEDAQGMADDLADPYLIGLVKVIRGQTCLQSGAWQQALGHCDEGMLHLQEHATGVAWECDVAAMGAIRALEEIGDFSEMYTRAERMLLQAEAVADKYAVAVARGYRMIARIAADQLDAAEDDSRFLSNFSSGNTSDQLHSIYTLRGLAMVKLARGEPEQAWDLVEEIWSRLKASGLLFAQIIRIDMWSLRARVALATVDTEPRRLAMVRRAEKILAQQDRLDARAWALLISGLRDWHGGETAACVEKTSGAADLFTEGGQAGMAALCRYRCAQFTADDSGIAEQHSALLECGVAAPARWAAAMAPASFRTD